tara:strand:- start:2607 stop:2834 length:228 start_codon:yes stop_codon:yes gene_type:complete
MSHDCYEQTHAIDWPAVNAMIRSFRQNMRDGYKTTLLFDPEPGRLHLACHGQNIADANGFVGTGVVSRKKEADSG